MHTQSQILLHLLNADLTSNFCPVTNKALASLLGAHVRLRKSTKRPCSAALAVPGKAAHCFFKLSGND
jgi:hypothetical protein